MSVDPGVLPELIERHFGSRPSTRKVLAANDDAFTALVRLGDRDVIVKAVGGNRTSRIAAEAWAYERAAEAGLPGSRVLAVDLTRQILPADALMLERCAGQPVAALIGAPYEGPDPRVPLGDLAGVLAETGRLLRRLHGIHIEAFGHCDVDHLVRTGECKGELRSWSAATIARLERRLNFVVRQGLIDDVTAEDVRRRMSSRAADLDMLPRSCLIHGDFTVYHVMVDHPAGGVMGFIDFEDVSSGDPVADLATFSKWEEHSLTYVLEGYEPDDEQLRRLEEIAPLYRIQIMVSAVAWCAEERYDPSSALRRLRRLLAG